MGSRRDRKLREVTASVPMPFTGPGLCPLCSTDGPDGTCPDEGCENYGGPVNDEY